MTRKRNDSHSTEFGLWLREQNEIDSSKGFVTTNIDYLWFNYKNKKWMLIEEKRFNSEPTFSQNQMFKIIKKACESDSNFLGFHVLKFSYTNPDDGEIYWDNKKISKLELLKVLLFK